MRADVVGHGLEVAQDLLGLVDDGLVLEHGAVVLEVEGRRLRRQRVARQLRVMVPLAERLKRCDRLCVLGSASLSVMA